MPIIVIVLIMKQIQKEQCGSKLYYLGFQDYYLFGVFLLLELVDNTTKMMTNKIKRNSINEYFKISYL